MLKFSFSAVDLENLGPRFFLNWNRGVLDFFKILGFLLGSLFWILYALSDRGIYPATKIICITDCSVCELG